eukprot:403365539
MEENHLDKQIKEIIEEYNDRNEGSQIIDTKETDDSLNQLLASIGESYERDQFSMFYKDRLLEKEYLKTYHQKIKSYGLIYTIEVMIVWALYLIFQTARLILLKYNYPQYKWAVLATVAFYLQVATHYLLARRYSGNNDTRESYPGFCRLICNNSCSLSFCCFCELQSKNHSHFLLTQVNIQLSLGVVYAFSRFSQNRDRERFEQNKNQKQLLRLFHNLIKVYHDGILITQNEKIVYNNKAVSNIFEVKNNKILNQNNLEQPIQVPLESQASLVNQDQEDGILDNCNSNHTIIDIKINEDFVSNHDYKLIDAFLKTKPKQNKCAQHTTNSDAGNDQDITQFTDLWDYIQKNQQYLDPIRFNREYLVNPLDGIYFKAKLNDKSDNHGSSQQKVLQVFTQSLRLGNKLFVMTTIRDQSNWLEIEKQKNLSQLKTLAFASAAHEFRNPLNAINSSLQVLDNQIHEKEGKQFLETAKNCSKLMLYLVNDILDFSQIESKNLVLNYENTDLRKLAEYCFSMLQLKADIKDIKFSFEFSPDFPKRVYTDANRLAQIIINLLSNALKYTEEGFVQLVGVALFEEKQIKIMVKDSGVGMTQSQIQKLFIAFTKIMTNRHLNKEGVGLGLTISKNLAKALGGDIQIESEINKGSIFTLVLPFDPSEENSSQNYSSIGHQHPNQNSNENIFQIEDEDPTASLFNFNENSFNAQPMQDISTYVKRQIPSKNIQSLMSNLLQNELINHQSDSFSNIQNSNGMRTENTVYFSDLLNNQTPKKLRRKTQKYGPLPIAISRELNSQSERIAHYQSQSYSEQSQSKLMNQKKFYPINCECSKILIVDDDPFNLIALQGLLKQYNIDKVDQCYNGKQAIDKILINQHESCFNHQPYDLIIMDNQMPVLNGIDATLKLRDIQNHDIRIRLGRIVLLTGDERMMTNVEYQHIFDDIILKPLDSNILGILLMQTSSKSQF